MSVCRKPSTLHLLEAQKDELVYHAISTHDHEDEQAALDRSCGQRVLESHAFQNIMALVIVGNGVVIGLETDIRDFEHWDDIESAFLAIFVGELTFKLCVEGCTFFDPNFEDFAWNQFDFLIVGLGLFDVTSHALGMTGSGGFATIFRLCRLMRILRIFRLLKFLKRLYLLAVGLVEACKAILWVTLLMSIVLYVCGVVLVKTVGRPPETDLNHEFLTSHFGRVADSMLSLFIMMSSPNLPIYQEESGLLQSHPLLLVFFIFFITFGSFGIIAMLTGVINESMFENNEGRKQEKRLEHDAIRSSLGLRAVDLFEKLDLDDFGKAKVSDLQHIGPEASELLLGAGVNIAHGDILKFLALVDDDESGLIDMKQFVHSMEKMSEGVSPLAMLELHHYIALCNKKLSEAMGHLVTVDVKIEKQSAHIAEAVDKMLGIVAGNAFNPQSGAHSASSDEKLSHEIRSCESRILSVVSKQSEDINRIVQRVADKQCGDLENILPKIVMKECESVVGMSLRPKLETILSSIRDLTQNDARTAGSADQIMGSKSQPEAKRTFLEVPLNCPVRVEVAKSQLSQELGCSASKLSDESRSIEPTVRLMNKLDAILSCVQDLTKNEERERKEDVKFQRHDAVTEFEDHVLSAKLKVVEKQVDSLEGKLFSGVAELGGIILAGMSDLLSKNQVIMKQEWTAQRELSSPSRFAAMDSPSMAAAPPHRLIQQAPRSASPGLATWAGMSIQQRGNSHVFRTG